MTSRLVREENVIEDYLFEFNGQMIDSLNFVIRATVVAAQIVAKLEEEKVWTVRNS